MKKSSVDLTNNLPNDPPILTEGGGKKITARNRKGKASKVNKEGAIAGDIVPMQTSSPQREDYEAEDALRTLVRVHKMQLNKGLMRRVKEHARRENEAHKRVMRLEGKLL